MPAEEAEKEPKRGSILASARVCGMNQIPATLLPLKPRLPGFGAALAMRLQSSILGAVPGQQLGSNQVGEVAHPSKLAPGLGSDLHYEEGGGR